jgi:hypothetical protein
MASYQAYTGIWHDRSYSVIYGTTLTLSIRSANFLVSALTVAVTISATCFWIVVAFLIQQVIIQTNHPDLLDLQRQVSLRNSSSSLGSLWNAITLGWAWRRTRARNVFRRSAIVAVPALLIWISFAAASILVAEVASKSYEGVHALLVPYKCGYYEYDIADESGFEPFTTVARSAIQTKVSRDTSNAQSYAKNMYSDHLNTLAMESQFPSISLPFHNVTVSCPFASKRCLLGPSSAFSVKTEPLDSHIHFGINARKQDRVLFETNLTCSVLDVEDLTSIDPSATYLQFALGPKRRLSNYTYEYDMRSIGANDYTIP